MLEGFVRAATAFLRGMAATLAGSSSSAEPRAIGVDDVLIMEIAPGRGPAWGTLSGLSAHPVDPSRLYAITDQDSAPIRVIEITVSSGAAEVTGQIAVVAPGLGDLDSEGIAAKPGGGFWLASEGAKRNVPPNLLVEVDAAGRLQRSIGLPASIAERMPKKGLEGVTLASSEAGARLVAAFQAPIGGDPEDRARIGVVDPASGDWTFFHYPLSRDSDGEVTGLSEVLALGGGRFAAIERDGKGGKRSIKWITTFALSPAEGAVADAMPPLLTKHVAVDLVPVFLGANRKVEKEIEGLAVATDGNVYAITDNDSERPTLLLRLGPASKLFK